MSDLDQPTRRRPKSAASQEEILEHATRLFGLHGFDGVSLRSISEASGVSLGSIYYYFPEKGHLYNATVSRVMDRQSQEVRRRLKLGATQKDSVRNFFDAMSAIVRGDSPANLLVRRAHLEATNPEAADALRAYAERAVAWHRDELNHFVMGMAPDCPQPARLLMRLYYLAWGSAIMEPLTCPTMDAAAHERISQDLVDAGMMLVRSMSKAEEPSVQEHLVQAKAAAETLMHSLGVISEALGPGDGPHPVRSKG